MRILISLLSFIILLGCSGESSSQDKITEKKAANKESSVLGLFGKKEEKEYVISSPLEGTLTKDGKPLVNSEIIRRVYWNGNDEGVVDVFKSDEFGMFKIPAYKVALKLSSMAEFVGKVELFAISESDSNFFWYSVKRSEEIYSDFDGPLKGLICDLAKPDITVEMKEFPAITRCRWVGMKES